MNNTQLRIISAFLLVLVLAILFYMGPLYLSWAVGVIGVIVTHEVLTSFYRIRKRNNIYWATLMVFALAYALSSVKLEFIRGHVLTLLAIFYNSFLLWYLFKTKMSNRRLILFFRGKEIFVALFFLIPFLSFNALIYHEKWLVFIVGLLIVNFSVDTFAWFFGKAFGKHKLWPSVSPNKTIEGTFGGIFCAIIVTSVYWNNFVSEVSFIDVVCFMLLGSGAQLGDLIQSKLKRQFNVKDSSHLIPGHGGFYDRIDSLLFVAPLFVLFLKLTGEY